MLNSHNDLGLSVKLLSIVASIGCMYMLYKNVPFIFDNQRYELATSVTFEILNIVLATTGRLLIIITTMFVFINKRGASLLLLASLICSLLNSALYSYPNVGMVFTKLSVSNVLWHIVPLVFYSVFYAVLRTKENSLQTVS
ncbi:hypothetical protein CGI68_23770 [Vibrio parahaemolyticus]|nr:hypothetical protein AJ90_26615 [Vibrio parahaemolyticus M0605]TOI05208.1 hypothetical protein CGI68_23770 [Vibrio parahaemolyticus]